MTHPSHAFCHPRFCVPRELHHELLATLDDALDPATEAWLLQGYQAEAEALEHGDTFEITAATAADYLRVRVRTWRALRAAQARRVQPRSSRPRRRRRVSVEAA